MFENQINPIFNDVADAISELRGQIKDINSTRQIYQGDWYEFTETLVYSSPTEITIQNANVDLRKIFSIGDAVRYKQGGDFKYGYLTRVEQNRLRIRAGQDFSVSNSAITNFARGLKANPTGFPVLFSIANNQYTVTSGSLTFSAVPDFTRTLFYMNGQILTIRAIVTGATVSVNGVGVRLNTPAVVNEVTCPFRPNYFEAGASSAWGVAKVTPSNNWVEIVPSVTFGGFSNAAGSTNWNFSIDFLALDT